MNLKEAAGAAKDRVAALFADDLPEQMRLEEFLFDDHLGVWSLTIGFTRRASPESRIYKIVRVAESDKSVISIKDR